jgi:GTP-binding protein YchF
MKSGKTKELELEEAALANWFGALSQGKMVSTVELSDDEKAAVRDVSLLTNKPVLYVLNVGEDYFKAPSVTSGSDGAEAPLNLSSQLPATKYQIPISIKLESEIVDMPPDDQTLFLEELGLKQSGLDRLITKCYELLNLITFLTSGEKETRAWTITRGAKAPQAAGVIHTDFEKGFIRAEVMSYEDFVACDGEAGARDAGRLRVEGKDYVMQDGDVCHFRVST